MKKAMYKARISFFTFGALALWLTLSSCANSAKSAPERIDNFVVNAQVNSKNYTSADWEKSSAEYRELIDEYEANKDIYSAEDKQRVANAVGKYHALLLEHAINEGKDSLMKAIGNLSGSMSMLPAYIEGFKDIFAKDSLGLNNIIGSILSSGETKEGIDAISSILEILQQGSNKVDSLINSSDIDILRLLNIRVALKV